MSALNFNEVKKTYDPEFLEVVYHLEMFNSANNYQLFLVGINQMLGYNVKFGFVDKLGNVASVFEKVKSEQIEEFVSNVQNVCTQEELTLTVLYTKQEETVEKEFTGEVQQGYLEMSNVAESNALFNSFPPWSPSYFCVLVLCVLFVFW